MGRKNGRGWGKEGKRARNAEILLEYGNVFPHTYVEQTHSPILDRKHCPVVQSLMHDHRHVCTHRVKSMTSNTLDSSASSSCRGQPVRDKWNQHSARSPHL